METITGLVRQYWAALQSGGLPDLGSWNYILLSILIVVQGPLATLLGGAAAATGLLRPSFVFVAGVVGNLTADVLWYSTGYLGRFGWAMRLGERLGFHPAHMDRLKCGMRRHATKILLLAKISAGLAVPALFIAGLTRLQWRRWFPVVFLGETLWTGTLVLVGFLATETIFQVERGVKIVAMLFSAVVLLAILYFLPRAIRHSDLLNVAETELGVQVKEGSS